MIHKITNQKELDDLLEKNPDECVEIEIVDFTAVLWGNSHAVLRGNSHAVLRGNSHAELWGNSHAELWEFSCVHIFDQAKVQVKSPRAIIIRSKYPKTVVAWIKLKGLLIKDGKIELWKITKKDGTDWYSGKVNYDTDHEIIAPDWDANYKDECGSGLHLADSPSGARYFLDAEKIKTARLFLVEAKIKDCRAFPGRPQYSMKLRARACKKIKEFPIDYEGGDDEQTN